MPNATYYADGEFNFYCDLCGRKDKSGNAMRTWDGFYVCKHHKEIRNEQDFVRGVRDDQTVPWSRSYTPPTYVTSTFRLLQQNGSAILQENLSNLLVS